MMRSILYFQNKSINVPRNMCRVSGIKCDSTVSETGLIKSLRIVRDIFELVCSFDGLVTSLAMAAYSVSLHLKRHNRPEFICSILARCDN